MDEGRRRRVIGVYRNLFVYGLLLAIFGIAVALVGLLLALMAGFWWALWIGVGMFALGLLTWLIGSVGTFGIAQTQAEEAARRFLSDRDDQPQ
jgi:pilus assembly protein TadC